MDMNLEIFITTNGRSTFKHCLKSVQELSMPTTITIIQNMGWREALFEMMARCQSTHFLRVDDDFILDKIAVEYMWKALLATHKIKSIAQYGCLLWETWTDKPISGVKLYNRSAMKRIGGHHFDKFGKADKATNAALQEAGFIRVRDPSIVGLHICGSWKEQQKYENLWRKTSLVDYQKSTNDDLKEYCKNTTLTRQLKLRGKYVYRKNRTQDTGFSYYIREEKIRCLPI